jgi:hypothetical protein
MTQYITDTVECGGIPRFEYRYVPEQTEIERVTIEFIPDPENRNSYSYSHPLYTFTQIVAIRHSWEVCQQNTLDWREELTLYRVCCLRLIEPISRETQRLTDAPFWLYGVTSPSCSDLLWFDEDELISIEQMQQEQAPCNYYEPYEI